MNCPACGRAMTEMAVGDLKVDACSAGCGGLWFDTWELRKVEENAEAAAPLLELKPGAAIQVDPERRRNCPRDPGVVMMRHFWSVKREVTVDECPQCGGMFLDAGELARIRAEYPSEAERHAAMQSLYGNMLAELTKQH